MMVKLGKADKDTLDTFVDIEKPSEAEDPRISKSFFVLFYYFIVLFYFIILFIFLFF
jgi:hypothetical protein